MAFARPLHAIAQRVPRGLLALVGLWLIVRSALAAQGGRAMLWTCNLYEQHRFTSMAILNHTLRLRNNLSAVQGDEQIFGGAGYTNWGFGVPLLQAPFHAAARWLHTHGHLANDFVSTFFPDRAIFFAYLVVLMPILWWTFSHVLEERQPGRGGWLRRNALAWAATVLVLTLALYPLMSARFFIYEETICYFMIFELCATCAYVFARSSEALLPVVALAASAGIGVLVRPTGFIYCGMWSLLMLLERRTRRSLVAFGATVAPFVVAALWMNRVKAASALSFGYENSMPWFSYHTGMVRFGNYQCADTAKHAYEAAAQLFEWLFVNVADTTVPHLQKCHFIEEIRSPDGREPFFGMPVFAVLVWIAAHFIARRERRLSLYVPFAVFLLLFSNYARTVGFAWRYTGDFWPLIVLVVVQYVRWLPRSASELMGLRLALATYLVSLGSFSRYVEPALSTIQKVDPSPELDAAFKRALTATDGPLPSKLTCGLPLPSWPYHQGRGWLSACAVDTYTNVFLGVPKKADDHYELRFSTEGVTAPTLRVYVDGRIFVAHRSGKDYVATVKIDYAGLHTPAVQTAVEWTAEPEPISAKLLTIELV